MNETIEQQALREFVCECSSVECVERLTLTLRQYEQVRAEGTRFVLAPGLIMADRSRVRSVSSRLESRDGQE